MDLCSTYVLSRWLMTNFKLTQFAVWIGYIDCCSILYSRDLYLDISVLCSMLFYNVFICLGCLVVSGSLDRGS